MREICIISNQKLYCFPALPVLKNVWGSGAEEGELSLKKGDALSLHCETGNTTVADVTWYKDNEPLPVQRYASRNTIKISAMSGDDFGVYKCQAVNSLGVKSRKIKVVNGEAI